MNNWGIACGGYYPDTDGLTIEYLDVIQPVVSSKKETKSNSKDVDRSTQLYEGVIRLVQQADITFIEVPVGSQNARAGIGNGICFGILGAFRVNKINFIELTPKDIKLAATGFKNATKKQIVTHYQEEYPDTNWPMKTFRGKQVVNMSKANHMADAIGAIEAGIKSLEFKDLNQFIINVNKGK